VNHNPFFAIADRAEELRPAGDHALDAALARLTSTLRTLTPNVRAR
jgi:hypothetical protein